MSKTTYSAPRYVLGTATHLFTALPEFRSGMEAADYAKANRLNAFHVVFVHERRDAWRLGVNFGTTSKIVATVAVS